MRVYFRPTGLMVDWCHLGQRRLTEPFFEQTVQQCLNHPADLLFRHQTTVEFLGELAAAQSGLAPAGFIFHMSRCGSTLVSQMLAALPRNIVISEAPPIDEILRLRFQDPQAAEQWRIARLRWLVSVLGRQRHPEQQHVFIKFDCWHALFLPLIRRAFPQVPWIFLYRDPVEVLVSHENHRGAQMIPGMLDPAMFGWDMATLGQMSMEEYGARVLAKICEAALAEIRDGSGKLVNYRQLPSIWPALMQHWKLNFSPEEMGRMLDAAKLNAKNPVLPFEDDTKEKNERATGKIRDLARQWLEPVYQELEKQRRGN